jgi:hypothetical protein
VELLVGDEVVRERAVLGPQLRGGLALAGVAREIEALVVARAGEGGEPCRDGVVAPGLDRDVVGGIGVQEVDRGSREQPIEVLGRGAIPAQESVIAQGPQVAGTGRGRIGQLAGAEVGDLARAYLGLDLGQEVVDLADGVANPLEGVLGAQFLEELPERGLVPLGELGGAVVGNRVGGRVEVGALEPDDRDLDQPQRLGGLQARVPGDDLARGARHDGLAPAEAPDRGRDVGNGLIVVPRVCRAREELPDGHQLHRENVFCHHRLLARDCPGATARPGEAWSWWHGMVPLEKPRGGTGHDRSAPVGRCNRDLHPRGRDPDTQRMRPDTDRTPAET